MITHRIIVNKPGLMITESDFIEDTPRQKYENNYNRIFNRENKMAEERNERSDKGTVRELTQIAEKIKLTEKRIVEAMFNAREDLENGITTGVVFNKLEEKIHEHLSTLEEDIRSFDQRDRLQFDPSIKG